MRELIIHLALKDLKVKYRRPILGFLWAFFIPFFTVIILQIVFSVILRVPLANYPFFIYLMTAVFPWRFFQASLTRATTSILDEKHLVKETHLARELIPLSVVLAELINFIPALCIMLIFLLFSGITFSVKIFYLPLIIILHTILIIGISFFTASLQVRFRDVKYIVEIALVGLFYLTPVFYSLDTVAQVFNQTLFKIYLANPLVAMVNLYRISLLPGFVQSLPSEVNLFNLLGLPLIWAVSSVILGWMFFKKTKATFNDYLSI